MNEPLWDRFRTTGRVEDYLRYRGIPAAQNSAAKEETTAHAPDNRRADHPGTPGWRG